MNRIDVFHPSWWLFLLALTAPVFSQELSQPAPVAGPSIWIVDNHPSKDSPLIAVAQLPPGTHAIIGYSEDAEPLYFTITITRGATPLPPGPVPPVPPLPPVPPVPVVSGKRLVVLVHESNDDTPEVASMLVALRSGPAAQYLKEKQHTLEILDDDSVDQFGRPTPKVEKWRPAFAGVKMPALIVVDPLTNKTISVETIADKPSALSVIDIVKKAGG